MVIQNDDRLDGWKAIANFLGRERTTAMRWAIERGLPVHRVPGGRTGTVYALRSELDAWLASDRADPVEPGGAAAAQPSSATGATTAGGDPAGVPPTVEAERPMGRRFAVAAGLSAAAIVAVFGFLSLRALPAADAPVSIAAVASPDASRDTLDFARALNADLVRFANASPALAVFDPEPTTAPRTDYACAPKSSARAGK